MDFVLIQVLFYDSIYHDKRYVNGCKSRLHREKHADFICFNYVLSNMGFLFVTAIKKAV